VRLTLTIRLLLAASAAHAAQAPSDVLDLPAFLARLDQLAAAVERADERATRDLLVQIPSTVRVRTGDLDYEVSLEPVAQRLSSRSDGSGWAARRARAHAQLVAIRGEAARLASASGATDTAAARQTLEGILARREFARHQTSTWGTELRQRVLDWIRRLLEGLGGAPVSGRAFALTFAWLAALAAVAGLASWLARELRGPGRLVRFRIGPPDPARSSSREWGLRAIAAARAGQTREAVRCAYRSAIRRLEEEGAWRLDESRTPREYARLLEAGDSRAAPFRSLSRQFENVLYGDRPLSGDEVVRLADHLEKLGCVRAVERAI
jgi:hypothetical protein